MNKFYETIIIFNGDLTEEKIHEKESEYVHNILHAGDESILAKLYGIDSKGKKKLAYEITRDDKTYSTGWYTVFTYETQQEKIMELEKLMKIDNDVIKYMTVILDNNTASDVDTSHIINEQDMKLKRNPKIIDAMDVLLGLAKYN